MKKAAAVIVALIINLSLTACGNGLADSVLQEAEKTTAAVSSEASAATEEAAAEAESVSGAETEPAESPAEEEQASAEIEGSVADVIAARNKDKEGESTPEPAQDAEYAAEETAESAETVFASANTTSNGAIDASGLFTERDLAQTADLTDAQYVTVTDGLVYEISTEGVYVFTGNAANTEIIVDAGDSDKVQIVLDGVTAVNESVPFLYVKNADKVFVTTTGTENSLSVTGSFQADGDVNTDAVLFSRDDLVLNGQGTLTVSSTDNGISGKDDIKITGGTLIIDAAADGIEANEMIAVADGRIEISAAKDALHAENDEDNTTGNIYICGGSLELSAGDDGIQGTTITQIDGGSFRISAAEAVEGTWVQINGGTFSITASDDGINASAKSGAYSPVVEINGGEITISMGAGDTDAVDSNGDLYINGGTLDITAQSPFDYDGNAEHNGGTIIVNGEESTITNQMMGPGGGFRGPGGGFGSGQDFGGGSGSDTGFGDSTGGFGGPGGDTGFGGRGF